MKKSNSLKSKRKIKKDKDLSLIKDYYKKSYDLLSNNKRAEAIELMYVQMPLKLYDKSLDILYNRNKKTYSESLRTLIEKVDNILNYSEEKEETLQEDSFQNY